MRGRAQPARAGGERRKIGARRSATRRAGLIAVLLPACAAAPRTGSGASPDELSLAARSHVQKRMYEHARHARALVEEVIGLDFEGAERSARSRPRRGRATAPRSRPRSGASPRRA
jgi:hypothetical protein